MLAQGEDTGLAQPLPRKGGVQHSNSPKEKGWGYLGAQRLQSKEPCFTVCPSTHGECSSYEAVFFCPAGSWGTGELGRGVAACFGKGQGAVEGASQAWPL